MVTPVCRGLIVRTAKDVVRCEFIGKPECPMYTKEYRKLGEEPCCYALLIPARFLSQNRTRQLAARKYVEKCLLV